jgi:hypothetical protein
MYTTEKTVTLLRTIAIIAGLAVTMWSLGLGTLQFVDAANITDVSDTLSDSAPSVGSNHTISFVTPTGVANGATTTITFPAGFTGVGSLGVEDVDFATTSNLSVATDCSGSERVRFIPSGQTVSFVFCPGDGGSLAAGATTTIRIGTNAAFPALPGNTQIVNPASEGSYEIGFNPVGASDSGWTRVVILNDVEVTAAVDTVFTFTVAGLPTGSSVNGTTTTGSTGSTTIPFGTLVAGTGSTTAQRLAVTTNAANGYSVTVQVDQPLQSSTGADIDGFANGSYTNTPVTWTAPTAVLGSENTYGHWGFTSDDTDTTRSAGDEFGANEWAAASTSPRVVMSHTGPSNGTGVGVGTTTVGYKVQISSLQEAGDDYSTTLTYVATPVF